MTEIRHHYKKSKANVKTLRLQWWAYELLTDYESSVSCVTGGYGIGKTFIAALWCYERLRMNEGCDAIFVEPTFSLTKTVAIPAFEDVFSFLGLIEGVHYEIRRSTDNIHIKLATGQKVHFLSAETPKKLVGFHRVAIAVLDEAGVMTEEVFQKARARARFKKAKKPQVLVTGTPEGLNWFADLFDSDTLEGWNTREDKDHHKWVTTEIRKGVIAKLKWRRFRATTYSNQANLSSDYIPNLLDSYRHNQNYIDSYLFGLFRPFAQGLAYSNYKSIIHRVKDTVADPHLPLHITFDFNIVPTWTVIQQHRERLAHGNHKVRHRAIYNSTGVHDSLEDSILELLDSIPRSEFRLTPIYIYGDSSGHAKSHKVRLSDYQVVKKTLHKLGFKKVVVLAIVSNPLERISVDAVQRKLAEREFEVCDRCTNVLKSLTRTTWKDNEKQKLAKPKGETWTHPMDSVKYYFVALEGAPDKRIRSARQ